MEGIKLVLAEEQKELVVREGNALPVKEPVKISILGIISTVTTFIKYRLNVITPMVDTCHILVNRVKMTISLVIDECNHYSGFVSGKLSMNPDFLSFGINTGKSWSHKDLAEFIKMNRSCFADREVASVLAADLSKLKVKVETEVEKSDDNRANVVASLRQTVIENTIPESFYLNMPIFQGKNKVSFPVSLYIDAMSYQIKLVSPDAKELVDDMKDEAIGEELEKIKEILPEIVIMEVITE